MSLRKYQHALIVLDHWYFYWKEIKVVDSFLSTSFFFRCSECNVKVHTHKLKLVVLLLTLKFSIQLLSMKWSAHVLWEKRRIYNVVSIVATASDVKIKALKKVFVAIANFLFIAKDNPYEICLCHHYIPFDYPNLKERFTYNASRIK